MRHCMLLYTLVIIYNYVLFGFRSNIIFIILYDLQYSDLCVYLIRDPMVVNCIDAS